MQHDATEALNVLYYKYTIGTIALIGRNDSEKGTGTQNIDK